MIRARMATIIASLHVVLTLLSPATIAQQRNLAVDRANAAASEKRVALAIGNNIYQHLKPLEKAVNDARAVGNALKAAGFATRVLENVSRTQMNRAVNQFVADVSGGGIGVFFFAGHGVQFNNQNFLIPVDLQDIESEADIADQGVSLQGLQDKLADARSKFSLLVIDACRDNPLPRKAGRALGGTRGLTLASSAEGQIVVFSAGANQQALDKLSSSDTNPNGVFTREFLPWLVKPGVTIRDAMLQVRSAVRASAKRANHDQFPAMYDQAEGNFYFVQGEGPQLVRAEVSLPALLTAPSAPAEGGISLDDIEKQQASRAQWATWQARMKADYDKVLALNAVPELQAAAWGRFLANYAQDNPYSSEDAELRTEAAARRQAAETESARQKAEIEQKRRAAAREREDVEEARQRREAERLRRDATQLAYVAPTVNAFLENTKWDMPTPYSDSNFHTKNVRQFADDVRAATGGKLEITVRSNASLIKHPDIKRAVQTGQVNIGELLISVLSNESPIYAFDSNPFLVANYNTAKKLWKAAKPHIEKRFDAQGIQLLYSVAWPPQGIYTKKPLNSIADLKGTKFRTYSLNTSEFARQIGAIPTTLPVPEVPQAFITGTVDAMITSGSTGVDTQAWDYLRYYYDTEAFFPQNVVIVNKAAFVKLDAAVQSAVIAAATTAEERGWATSAAENQGYMKIMASKGIAVEKPNARLRDELNAVGKVMAQQWVNNVGADAQTLLNEFGR